MESGPLKRESTHTLTFGFPSPCIPKFIYLFFLTNNLDREDITVGKGVLDIL